MGFRMPLSNKVTLIPHSHSTMHADPYENTGDFHWFPFYFLIMMPNTIGTMAKAYRRSDYSLMFFCVSICVCFFFLQLSRSKYMSLPNNDKSSQKFVLKFNMWVLYTVISFGFVYQFSDFFPPQTTMALYIIVSVCSSVLFYIFVIVDVAKYWMLWREGKDETTLDGGKLDKYSISILEKV